MEKCRLIKTARNLFPWTDIYWETRTHRGKAPMRKLKRPIGKPPTPAAPAKKGRIVDRTACRGDSDCRRSRDGIGEMWRRVNTSGLSRQQATA